MEAALIYTGVSLTAVLAEPRTNFALPWETLDVFFVFFFNDTAPTEIYTLSLHDALPICRPSCFPPSFPRSRSSRRLAGIERADRKSTRLNSSHQIISYAVFCLKKKKKKKKNIIIKKKKNNLHKIT